MDECGSNQHTGTEMFAEEEDLGRDGELLEFLGYDWETSASDTGEEDNDCTG